MSPRLTVRQRVALVGLRDRGTIPRHRDLVVLERLGCLAWTPGTPAPVVTEAGLEVLARKPIPSDYWNAHGAREILEDLAADEPAAQRALDAGAFRDRALFMVAATILEIPPSIVDALASVPEAAE